MLEPVTKERYGDALALLNMGFPHRSRRYWETAIDRIERFCTTGPVGQFLIVDGRAVGVVLTLHNERTLDDQSTQRSVNTSGWCIQPEYRSRGPFMLHAMLKPDVDVYTDLTPSKDVSKLLQAVGYRPLNRGVSIITLPYMALAGPKKGEVRAFEDLPSDAFVQNTHDIVARHADFGALVAGFWDGTKWQPLIFTSRVRSRIPMQELLYCEDNAALIENLGAVARFLVGRGKQLLTLDMPLDGTVPGVQMPGRGLKFARGDTIANQTDYAGSELFLLDL